MFNISDNYLQYLTPCDGYVSQPQSPVIVVVSSRFTAEGEKRKEKKKKNRGDKWWTLNDCFFFSSSTLSFIAVLCVQWHPTDSHTQMHTCLTGVTDEAGRLSRQLRLGVIACDVTLTWFTLWALWARTSEVHTQNRAEQERCTVQKMYSRKYNVPHVWLAGS